MRNVTKIVAALFSAALLLPGQQLPAQAPDPGTDMTDHLLNPNFVESNTDTVQGWINKKIYNPGNAQFRFQFNEYECWNGIFDLYQDVKELPAGIYELSLNGFYRDRDGDAGLSDYKTGKDKRNSELYCTTSIRTMTQDFPSVWSVDKWEPSSDFKEATYNGVTRKYVNGMTSAKEAFTAGQYEVTVKNIFVGEDGVLRLGARSKQENEFVPYSWTLLGNFKLTYVRAIEDKDYSVLCDVLADEILVDYGDLKYSGALKMLTEVEALYNSQEYGSSKEEILNTRNMMDGYKSELKAGRSASDSLNNIHLPEALKWVGETGYSQDAKAALQKLIDMAYGYVDEGNKEDGTPVYAVDIRALSKDMVEAIRQFRFSKIPTEEEKKNGMDFTWCVTNPNFTETGYDISDDSHATGKGWTSDNRKADGSAAKGDFRLNYVGRKNCWNSWAANSTDCAYMGMYQELTGLPTGYYTISALHATADPVLKQHFYGKTAYEQKNSNIPEPNVWEDVDGNKDGSTWSPVQVDSVFVGADGYLRIGMESELTTSTPSGWFCFTEVKLTYFPAENVNSNELIRTNLLAQADTLLKKDFLPIQKNWLSDAKTTLADADISTDELATAAFEAYNEVIDSCQTAIKDYAAFTQGDYATLNAYAENAEGLYEANLVAFLTNLKPICDGMLANPELNTVAFGVMKDMVKDYITFVEKYLKIYDIASISTADAQKATMAVLAAQLTNLTNDMTAVEAASEKVAALEDWNKAYETLYLACEEGTYAEADCEKAKSGMAANAQALAADPALVEEKTKEMYMIYRDLTLTIDRPEGEVTDWIVNANIVQDGGNGDDPNGWTCWAEGTNNQRTTDVGDPDTNFEVWAQNSPGDVRFDYKQTLHALPAGLYRLTVEAADRRDAWAKEGESMLYAQTSENWVKETSILSHPIMTDQLMRNDTVWKDNNDHSLGWDAINEVEDLDNATYDTYTVDHITILNDGADLTIGVRCENGKTARWLCFDNFKLYMLKRYNTGIEEIGGDAAGNNSLKAYAQNGRIVVEGAEEYTIYSIDSSSAYDKDAQLIPGIYIVKAGDKQTKVVVD